MKNVCLKIVGVPYGLKREHLHVLKVLNNFMDYGKYLFWSPLNM
jgi:hypothetical protein